MSKITIIQGDSQEKLKGLADNSVDSICCDPPYGLKFMSKAWDYDVPKVELWQEVLRVLKPGGHLLSFAGSRTYHRMAVNIEDAGFDIRDQIMWVYGSGFPKSHNIGKAVDKLGANPYEGWGTALKPAHEPIVVARKPLSEKTIAKNVLEWGTGGINIDGCRVEFDENEPDKRIGTETLAGGSKESMYGSYSDVKDKNIKMYKQGRFPANFIHDGSDEVTDLLGEPARFFYCAKASKKDRNEGLEEFETKQTMGGGGLGLGSPEQRQAASKYGSVKAPNKNSHPTVKPTALMQYLVRLVTPVGGTVLDPFMGSGSTGKACVLEGFDFIGIDLDPEYCKIAQARIDHVPSTN